MGQPRLLLKMTDDWVLRTGMTRLRRMTVAGTRLFICHAQPQARIMFA